MNREAGKNKLLNILVKENMLPGLCYIMMTRTNLDT